MKGIKTIKDLEKKLGVEIGDIVMCTYNTSPWDVLDLAVGIYNHYQCLKEDRVGGIRENTVDLFHGAKQLHPLVKSNTCFRVHQIGHTYGNKSKLWNEQHQVQIPVEKMENFQVVTKAKDVKKFFYEE